MAPLRQSAVELLREEASLSRLPHVGVGSRGTRVLLGSLGGREGQGRVAPLALGGGTPWGRGAQDVPAVHREVVTLVPAGCTLTGSTGLRACVCVGV